MTGKSKPRTVAPTFAAIANGTATYPAGPLKAVQLHRLTIGGKPSQAKTLARLPDGCAPMDIVGASGTVATNLRCKGRNYATLILPSHGTPLLLRAKTAMYYPKVTQNYATITLDNMAKNDMVFINLRNNTATVVAATKGLRTVGFPQILDGDLIAWTEIRGINQNEGAMRQVARIVS